MAGKTAPILVPMATRAENGNVPDPGIVREGGYQPTSDPGPVPASLIRQPADEEPGAPGSTLDDDDLVSALAHEDRVGILRILSEREASPRELAMLLDLTLSNVSYQVRRLKEADIVALVRTAPRHGAVEHYYRAKRVEGLPRMLEMIASPEALPSQGQAAE